MKKFLFSILAVCVVLLIGCFPSADLPQTDASLASVKEEIDAWPENEYTQQIPKPEYGTPDYTISGEENGSPYYSVFLKDITKEQGEQYAEVLKKAGYREISADRTEVSAGIILRKDTVHIGLAVSEGMLGIFISFLA